MELKDILQPFRKWWWLILLAMVLAGLASFLVTRGQPPLYRTQTAFMVGRALNDPNPRSNEFQLSQQLANTYADLIQRAPIRQATQAALGLDSLPDYTVRVVPDTQLIEVTVVDTDPYRAQAVANELVNQLILRTPGASDSEEADRQAFIAKQLNELEVGIEETEQEIERQQEKLATLFSARDIADTQDEIAALQNKLASLRSNYAALLDNTRDEALNTITIFQPAELPRRPISNNNAMMIVVAVALGFVLATSAAFLLDYLDDSLRTPQDVRQTLGLTALGTIPFVEEDEDDDKELVSLDPDKSIVSEAYRVLRTNLQFASVDKPLRRVLITSAAVGEGKSATTANLGVVLAQAGQQVIIVDADLHRPTMHEFFGLANSVGVTTALLQSDEDLTDVLLETRIPNLKVMTSGPKPPNPADLLGSARMREMLDALVEQADVVIIDSPPAIALSDAIILSTLVDGVLVAVKAGATRRGAVQRTIEALRQVQANVIGIVLTHVPMNRSGYYAYQQYGYYPSGPGGAESGGKKGKGVGLRRRRQKKATA
jgi:non-specific protein-tyrosine kinase